MTRHAWLLAFWCFGVTGCPTPAANNVDLGTVRLQLWQVSAPGNEDFLASSTQVLVDVTIAGETVTETLTDGRINSIETAPEGATVDLVLRVLGPFGEALARPDRFTLEPGGGEQILPAILALPGLTPLSVQVPDDRQGAAVCGDGEGNAVMLGGIAGGALAFGSWLADADSEIVNEGPGLVDRRTGTACAIVEETLWLAGGCDEAGDPIAGLQSAPLRGNQSLGAAGDPTPSSNGCGVVLESQGDALLLVAGDVFERRSSAGLITASLTLSQPHYFGEMIIDATGTVFVAGGTISSDGATPAGTGHAIAADGTVVDIPQLGPGTLLASKNQQSFAFTDSGIVALAENGTLTEFISSNVVSLPGGYAAVQMLPSTGDRFLFISGDGSALADLGPTAVRTIAINPPRPGAKMVALPGGAAMILGGATGSLIYVPDD